MRCHFVKPQSEKLEKDKNCDVNSYFDMIEESISDKKYVTVLFCGPYSKRGSNDNNLTLQLKDLALGWVSYTSMDLDDHRKKAESWNFLLTLLGLDKAKEIILNDIHGDMLGSLEDEKKIDRKLGSNNNKTGNWHCIMPNEWINELKLRNKK